MCGRKLCIACRVKMWHHQLTWRHLSVAAATHVCSMQHACITCVHFLLHFVTHFLLPHTFKNIFTIAVPVYTHAPPACPTASLQSHFNNPTHFSWDKFLCPHGRWDKWFFALRHIACHACLHAFCLHYLQCLQFTPYYLHSFPCLGLPLGW